MKIAHLGEISNIHIWRWLWGLRDLGHEVILFDIAKRVRSFDALKGITVVHIPPVINAPVLRTLSRIAGVRRELHRLRPDVFHCHFVSGLGVIGALSGFRPLVLTAYGSDLYVKARGSRMIGSLTTMALKSASVITGDSDDLLAECARFGADPQTLHKIQLGVDTKIFKPGPRDPELVKKHHIPESARVIYSARSMAGRYNTEKIIEAIPEVVATHSEALFLFATHECEPEYRERCLATARRLGVEENMRLLPPSDYASLPNVFRLADIAISVPSTDGTPVTMFEAMALGVPLAASDVPSLREWIRDGENGFLLRPDKDEIARVLSKFLENPEMWKEKFREPNLQIVRENADAALWMRRLVGLYESVIK